MKVRVKYNHWIPKLLRCDGITLYPFMFMRFREARSRKSRILHHEWIHIQQIRAEGFFRFYSRWLFYLAKNYLTYLDYRQAYLHIPYEKEAYQKMRTVKLPRIVE